MKIAILGAGAMGSLFGGYLAPKNDVTLVDIYKEHMDAVNKDGLRMRINGEVSTVRLKATTNPADAKGAELVIVFVKSTQTGDAIAKNLELFGDDSIVLSLQNGYGNDEDILKYIPRERVIMGTTGRAAAIIEPGFVNDNGGKDSHIGPLGADLAQAERIAKVLTESGLDAFACPFNEVLEMIWEKLLRNVAFNALTAALDIPTKFMSDDKYATILWKMILHEGVEVAIACGMPFTQQQFLDKVNAASVTLAPDHHTSMWQDMNKKRLTEIDKMNGIIVKKGAEKGIATPYNEFLVNFVHAVEGKYNYNM